MKDILLEYSQERVVCTGTQKLTAKVLIYPSVFWMMVLQGSENHIPQLDKVRIVYVPGTKAEQSDHQHREATEGSCLCATWKRGQCVDPQLQGAGASQLRPAPGLSEGMANLFLAQN